MLPIKTRRRCLETTSRTRSKLLPAPLSRHVSRGVITPSASLPALPRSLRSLRSLRSCCSCLLASSAPASTLSLRLCLLLDAAVYFPARRYCVYQILRHSQHDSSSLEQPAFMRIISAIRPFSCRSACGDAGTCLRLVRSHQDVRR